ncbi:MAG: hypothetical protein J3K34DRAFT_408016 [Monoraphidium minutum]|nr:MAG: hypothetical protein J3K34DRAFT_408016 [Monoraphidium minutum]
MSRMALAGPGVRMQMAAAGGGAVLLALARAAVGDGAPRDIMVSAGVALRELAAGSEFGAAAVEASMAVVSDALPAPHR